MSLRGQFLLKQNLRNRFAFYGVYRFNLWVPSEFAIDLKHVTKSYKGKVHALRGIDMRVMRGEVFGLLGPNGAGKSTLVKIMMTVVRATQCEGTVLDAPVGNKATLARVGYLPENHRFPRYLTGRQILHFFGALAKVDRRTCRKKANELLDIVGMTSTADRIVSTYSKGMAQRIGLAQAMINDPELILLDEPTDGVDPVGRRDIREVLHRLRDQKKTIFINSHQLSELDALCDRVAILIGGEVRRQGTVADLARAGERYEIEIAPTNNADDEQRLRLAAKSLFDVTLPSSDSPMTIDIAPPVLRIGTIDPVAIQAVLDSLRGSGCIIRRVQAMRPSLEDLFFAAVGQSPSPFPPGGVA